MMATSPLMRVQIAKDWQEYYDPKLPFVLGT